jgi:hypothetical protein
VIVSARHAAVVLLLAAACSDDPSGGDGGTPADPDAASHEDDMQFCVDETNRYRAMVDLPPLARNAELEAYATEGARIDGQAHEPHKHFRDTGGGGIAFAENEIPWWPISAYGTVRAVIVGGLGLMWAEGPSGPEPDNHYDNMTGPYTQVGCGIYLAPNGEVTVTQDLR